MPNIRYLLSAVVSCLQLPFHVIGFGMLPSIQRQTKLLSSYESDLEVGINEPRIKEFMLISDSTGMTAKTAISKCLSQFDWCDDECIITESGEVCKIRRSVRNFVRNEEVISTIVQQAKQRSAMATFTFADPNLRALTVSLCEKNGVPFVDLMGPMLLRMKDFLQMTPLGRSKHRVALNRDYFQRIEAIEFTLKADDGQAPWLLRDADVIIVGVSRTGKTPLSIVLSQMMELKVANVPLVLECPPPAELLDTEEIDSNRVFCLTINPSQLRKIRKTRLEMRGVTEKEKQMDSFSGNKSNYADRNYLINDLKNARELSLAHGWTDIDVTDRSVEETAGMLSEIITKRFVDDS